MPSNSSVGCCSLASASGDSIYNDQHSTFVEWNEGAVVLEMKVNEPAIVSIFCPNSESSESKCVEVVKFTEDSIEFIRDLTPENSREPTLKRFSVTFANQQFDPESVTAESWSESRRLFTCRVNLRYRDYVCGLRRFFEIQAYMSNKVPLAQYCEQLSNNGVKISCRVCLTTFLTTGDSSSMKFVPTSDDPTLDELGNGDMNDFVVHSCANQHGCHKEKSDNLLKIAHNKDDQKPNQPTADKTLLSDTYLTLKNKDSFVGFTVDEDSRLVKCKGCLNELGYAKADLNALQLNLTALEVDDLNLNRSLISTRFESPERYFAFLLLHHSGIDSSLKIIFRTCEKEPYILIWLVEPIFVFGGGKLKEVVEEEPKQQGKKGRRNSAVDSSTINTFCALKVLYRVFDSSTPSEQKPHTDSGISYIDIPLASCMALEEILLRNSTRLPNNSRILGNFLISFLDIEDD